MNDELYSSHKQAKQCVLSYFRIWRFPKRSCSDVKTMSQKQKHERSSIFLPCSSKDYDIMFTCQFQEINSYNCKKKCTVKEWKFSLRVLFDRLGKSERVFDCDKKVKRSKWLKLYFFTNDCQWTFLRQHFKKMSNHSWLWSLLVTSAFIWLIYQKLILLIWKSPKYERTRKKFVLIQPPV